MKFSDRNLQDLLGVIDARVDARIARQPRIEYGAVDTVSSDGNTASVLLLGSSLASAGFRVPATFGVASGDYVRVVISPSGDRFIAENLSTNRVRPGTGLLRFAPMRTVLINNSTTTSSISKTAVGPVSGVPSSAHAIQVDARVGSTVHHAANFVSIYHGNGTDAAGTGFNGPAGTRNSLVMTVQYDATDGFFYEVNVASGTVGIDLVVTGYWTYD